MPTNKDIVTAIFEQTATGNGRPFADAMAEHMEWRIIGDTSWSGTYRGKQDVLRNLLGPLRERLGRNTCVPTRILADGDFVVVQARGENTTTDGKVYRNDYCFVIRMEAGQIAAVEEYSDTALINEALGERRISA